MINMQISELVHKGEPIRMFCADNGSWKWQRFLKNWLTSNQNLFMIWQSQNIWDIVSVISLQKLHKWVSFNLHLYKKIIGAKRSI